jgi:hypothetical protein
MKKESISFSWDKYITGKYKVETSDGQNVILSGRNPDVDASDDEITGWCGARNRATSWTKDGFYMTHTANSEYNLVLIPIEEELEPVNEKTTDYAELPEELPEGEFYGFSNSDYQTEYTKKLSIAIDLGQIGTSITRLTTVATIKSKKVLERI